MRVLGAEPHPELQRPAGLQGPVRLRQGREAAGPHEAAVPVGGNDQGFRHDRRRQGGRCRRRSPPRSTSTTSWRRRPAGGEAHLRREADDADLRAEQRAGPDRGEEEADADGGAHLHLLRPRPPDQGDRQERRHRRDPVHQLPPAEPGALPEGHQRGVGPRPPRHLHHPVLPREAARSP